MLPLALSVPSICSNSAERFPWISITLPGLRKLRLRALSPPRQLGDLRVAPVGRLAPARLAQLLQRAVLADCLRQYVRCDVYRPSRRNSSPTSPGLVHASAFARISRLVLRRERPALGLLDQLGVRHPRRRGAPAGPESQLGYASLVFAAGGSPHPLPQLHSCSSPTCPAFSVLALKVIDSSMVSVSPDVDVMKGQAGSGSPGAAFAGRQEVDPPPRTASFETVRIAPARPDNSRRRYRP